MDSTPALFAFETVSANLRIILRGLMATMGMWRLAPAMTVALHRRVSAALGRIERMMIRFQAGRLWRRTQTGSAQRRTSRAAVRGLALPRRFGWLVQAGAHHAASVGTQLQTVLSTPEMAALLAASPQAGRILRPLCRALAVDLPGMADKPATERKTRPRKIRIRVKPEPFRIPLPRGVISAARRAGFGKLS